MEPKGVDFTVMLGSGVYVLLWAGEVVYVGQAKRLYRRIYTHRSLWERKRSGKATPSNLGKVMQFSAVTVYPCAESDLDRLEGEMIAKYRPKYNQARVPSAKLSLASLGLPMILVPRLRAEDRILRRL